MNLSPEELQLLAQMRALSPAENIPLVDNRRLGEQIADKITATVGSWRFLIIQTMLLLLWLVCNITAYIQQWDPYPFILLNLILSFQAAYTAPIIMMSQNREATIDRKKMDYYYNVNVKAELEIELLHHKVDKLLHLLERKSDSG